MFLFTKLFNSIPTNTFGILFTMFLANFLFTRFNFLKSVYENNVLDKYEAVGTISGESYYLSVDQVILFYQFFLDRIQYISYGHLYYCEQYKISQYRSLYIFHCNLHYTGEEWNWH